MTTEEKFHAAVNVIRSLPKDGPYQPSNDFKLKFYAYFKQATLGPCNGKRPAFWDVVARAKYDAWKRLGNMSKQEAMAHYVKELHEIVETMSYTDNVAAFLDVPSADQVSIADLQIVAGDVIERVVSQPNSPFASREASPQRLRSSLETSPATSCSTSPPAQESDHSDEEYIDTIEAEPEFLRKQITNGPTENIPNGCPPRSRPKTRTFPVQDSDHRVDISQEISRTVQSLKSDFEKLSARVTSLESSKSHSTSLTRSRRNKYWPFKNIPPSLLTLIIVWPFVAHVIMRYWTNRK